MSELQDRHFQQFKVVKLPKDSFTNNFGIDLGLCPCEPMTVCWSNNLQNTWEYDQSSAWAKGYDAGDTIEFKLWKEDGTLANYQPTPKPFARDIYSRYCTIEWNDVYASDGEGCYRLTLTITIAGVVIEKEWKSYKLMQFNAYKINRNIRIKAVLNGYRISDNIIFNDENVPDCIRIKGRFGWYQPNTKIENIIDKDNTVLNTFRNNTTSYELMTEVNNDPRLILELVKVHLLSENELYVSDHWLYNPVQSYLDHPVTIATEGAQVQYYEGSVKLGLKAKFTDRVQNEINYR